jgi:hypothetical protein
MTIWNGLFFGDGKEYQRCFLFIFPTSFLVFPEEGGERDVAA